MLNVLLLMIALWSLLMHYVGASTGTRLGVVKVYTLRRLP